MDLNLQDAIEQTIRHHLDGAGLLGIPGYRTIELEIDDDRTSARLVCPDHGSLIAELDHDLTVTVEYDCNECEIQSCNNCDTWNQRICARHTEHDEIPVPPAQFARQS